MTFTLSQWQGGNQGNNNNKKKTSVHNLYINRIFPYRNSHQSCQYLNAQQEVRMLHRNQHTHNEILFFFVRIESHYLKLWVHRSQTKEKLPGQAKEKKTIYFKFLVFSSFCFLSLQYRHASCSGLVSVLFWTFFKEFVVGEDSTGGCFTVRIPLVTLKTCIICHFPFGFLFLSIFFLFSRYSGTICWSEKRKDSQRSLGRPVRAPTQNSAVPSRSSASKGHRSTVTSSGKCKMQLLLDLRKHDKFSSSFKEKSNSNRSWLNWHVTASLSISLWVLFVLLFSAIRGKGHDAGFE